MKSFEIFKLLGAIAVCQLAGLISLPVTRPAIRDWYSMLRKPSFSPPNWLFGPAWTFLYLLMGIALYLIWQSESTGALREVALRWFWIQFALNAAWSFLFFGMRSPIAGLVDILLMWVAIAITIWEFWQISPAAGALLLPYIAWVTFATALNTGIVVMNR